MLNMENVNIVNELFTEAEINELDYEFTRYLIDLSDIVTSGVTLFQFKTSGRQFEYTIDNGIAIIFKLIKGFDEAYSDNPLTTDELLEVKSRFGNYSIDIGDKTYKSGFSTCKLGTGKAIWYLIADGDCVITNIIEPSVKPEKLGMKFDDDKLLCMAMPAQEYKQILEVLTNGAKKYKIDNWKVVDNARNRYMNGLERHFLDYKEAVQTGNEDLKFDNGEGGMGTHHLANLICNAIFLMYFDNNGLDKESNT